MHLKALAVTAGSCSSLLAHQNPLGHTLHAAICSCVQANPPKPSDETVFIEDRPALDVYAKSFGGWAVGQTYLQV